MLYTDGKQNRNGFNLLYGPDILLRRQETTVKFLDASY